VREEDLPHWGAVALKEKEPFLKLSVLFPLDLFSSCLVFNVVTGVVAKLHSLCFQLQYRVFHDFRA